ncbi:MULTISPECIES: hypothetical protein [unclassified Desulfovibrio]|uniref:hypothetical protein n=1 Tax=unclassified Desulfovibrio TaxID=2593640 RepID=UPI0013EBCB0F|nr:MULTISPECIES: hypothetical protein [unclassified Desulfovibrio]
MEKLPMVTVTARIMDQRGQPVPKARITMRLTTVERYCGIVVPRTVEAMTDKDGLAKLRVWPNARGTEGSEYLVTISFADACQSRCLNHPSANLPPLQSQRFRVVVPDADCNLWDIAELPPYEVRGSGQVITEEVAAFASQASNAADRAENAMESAGSIRASLEGLAGKAEVAKKAAQAAAKESGVHERHARELVAEFDDKVCHFQNTVIQQTEKTAHRMVHEGRTCITQETSTSLAAIEKRTGHSLSDISRAASDAQHTATETIKTAKNIALEEIKGAKENALSEVKEEVALANEDFDAILERAVSAAKRAGCSAASAANSKTDACACAERAERAALSLERANGDAMAAAERATSAAECAKADAQLAETAANTSSQQAENAKAAADVATRQAALAKASADAAALSAETARGAAVSAQENREHVDEVVRDLDQAILDAAAGIVTDEIVDAATAKATEDANAAAKAAQDAAAEAAASVDTSLASQALAAESAAEAADAAARAGEYASKLKDKYDAEVTVALMAKQIIDLSDRLTASQLAGLEACTALGELKIEVAALSDRVTGMELAAVN